MRKVWREQGVVFEKCNKMMIMMEAGVDTSASKKCHQERKAHVGVQKPRGIAHVRCQQGDAMRTTQSGRTENHL